MAFPFDIYIEKKSFNKTFLNALMFCVYFTGPKTQDADALEKRWRQFVKDNFGSDAEIGELSGSPVQAQSTDGTTTFMFHTNFANVLLRPTDYKSFANDMLSKIAVIYLYGKDVLKADGFSDERLRVADIWRDDIDRSEMREKYLSHRLTALGCNAEKDDIEEKYDDFTKYRWEEDDLSVTARTIALGDSSGNTLILDTEAICSPTEAKGIDELLSIASRLDALLYRLFVWSISDSTVELMEGAEA